MRILLKVIWMLCICLATMILPCSAAKMTPTLDGTLELYQVALGDIHPGDTVDHVKTIYGDAEMVEKASLGKEVHSYENGSFIITYENGKVKNILCTREGNKKTPDDVMMWDDEVQLGAVYGMASQVDIKEDDRAVYVYWGNISAPWQYMTFTVEKGSIVQISCGKAV